MVLTSSRFLWLLQAAFLPLVYSTSITDIQGPAFRSPFEGQTVTGVTGIVIAKVSSSGFYIQSDPVKDERVSNGLFVFTESSSVLNSVAVGDLISLSGVVQDFRSSSDPTFIRDTELDSPTDIKVISSGHTVKPVVLGVDRVPPTLKYSALDVGPDGFLSVPNNQSQIDAVNATLRPNEFGIDFWASLEGQLVTVPKPISIAFNNRFGEFWVRGDWPATSVNSRGGLTITIGPDGTPDAASEAVIIGTPTDGTTNAIASVGQTLSDITGVIQYQFGFFYIIPQTAPTVLTTPDPTVPPTTLTSSKDACTITIGDYNVDNLGPDSPHFAAAATDIATHLLAPDIMFLQEIQDNSGETDDGTVSANVTLSNLSAAIASQSDVTYNFTEVISVNDQDGGALGGNIRPAYLFNPKKVKLVPGAPVGGPNDTVEPVFDRSGNLVLNFNPGRLDPLNTIWDNSRKPLVALWETTNGARFFTINVHDTAKTGGSTAQSDTRPPINEDVAKRTGQVETIATFIANLLQKEPSASLIVGGDFNEFVQTRSVYAAFNGLVTEVDVLANVPPQERYTYVFDNTQEQLDHVFVSPAVAKRKVEVEHVHVNSWSPNVNTRTSDHDPSVSRVRVC